MKTFKLQVPVTIATLVSLLVLSAALLVLGRSIKGQDEAWEGVVHTREVLEHVQATLTLLSEAEAAQRGFLLTGNALFAASYRQAHEAVPAEIAALRALTRDNPRQQQSLQPLNTLMMQRLAMLEQVMERKRQGVEPDAATLESGRLLKQRILAQVGTIRAEEQRLLHERQRRTEAARKDLVIAVATVATLSACLIILLWVISSRDAARLLSERARLDATLRSIGDGVIATDAAGTVGLVNPVAEALTGTKESDAVGRPLGQVLRVRDEDSGDSLPVVALLAQPGVASLLLSGNEREHAIELSAAPIGAPGADDGGTVLVFRDVTERNARERALAESEANYRYTIELNPQIPWKASPQGEVYGFSERWLALTGQSRDSAGGGWWQAIFEQDLPRLTRTWAQAVASGEAYDAEHRIRTADGQVRWMRSRANPRRDAQGAIVAWYGLTEDIHARKESELAVIAANESLEQRIEERTARIAEANAELRAFAHTVAHDLRAPLRNIEGFATALLEDEAPRMSEDGQLFAGRIVAAVTRMDRLITDLLAYSRLSRTELGLDLVDTNTVMKTMLRDLEAQIRGSGARIAVAPALPAVRANQAVLVQIVDNLVSNAIKFVAPGVVPEVAIHGAPDGATVRLSIEDNGIGIAPEHREHVFGVFERLHGQEQYPGTGIGLAIVRKGLERMGGAVRILGREHGGTRFELTLPAA